MSTSLENHHFDLITQLQVRSAEFIDLLCFLVHNCIFAPSSKDMTKLVCGAINRHTFSSAH